MRISSNLALVRPQQFHPEFAYEGEEAESVENYTSRSPYPTVHLIRASLITAAREVPLARVLHFSLVAVATYR
jgi:hypothetical protein